MSFFNDIKTRQIQKRGNAFIKKLENKNDVEAKQLYLDNKEFHNNEIVLSYIFFHFPSLISLLPLDFQKAMINSNITSFKDGSPEAKKALVSDWLSENKFFMNIKQIDLDNEEYENYICMYFNQIDDVSKLYMDDLYRTMDILYRHDKRMTENVIETIKDKLSEKQWDFILKVDPMFIKYASEQVQNNYSEKEEFSEFISGSAKENYIQNQLDKIKDDKSLLSKMNVDVQKAYIINNPYVINNLDDDKIIELLKYDINLIKYINLNKLKNKEIIYSILENVNNKKMEEIIDIFIEKGLLNAKTKLYRYDSNSNNIDYQYSKRLIRLIQSLSFKQIITLINIDINYVLPYVVPLYNDKDERSNRESETLEANSRCLSLFKEYYGEEVYNKYYKVINKIYNEFIANIDKYNYNNDYDSIFDLFKVLFNKRIIENNNFEKISVFVGISLLYKGKENKDSKNASIKLLNELLRNCYKKEISVDTEIYNINSLEIFDDRLSFINKEILLNNNVLISSLLYIVKSNDLYLFKNYYEILINVFEENINTLLFAVDNFSYYKDILNDIKDEELNDEEIDNLIRLLTSNKNYLNIKNKNGLMSYDLNILKKLIGDFGENSDEIIRKNLVCNYLFNKPYDSSGTNLLYVETIKNYLDVVDSGVLNEINDFNEEDINLFNMLKLMFNSNDSELLISYIESTMNEKLNINIVSIINLFNKMEKNKMEIINKQVVTLDDIEMFYETNSGAVNKISQDGVDIYRFNNQDFKVLGSFSNDGIHYDVTYISLIDRNYYGYNKLINANFILSSDEGRTIVKYKKDTKIINSIKPDYIIVKNGISPDIINIARSNNLKIIDMGDTYEQ